VTIAFSSPFFLDPSLGPSPPYPSPTLARKFHNFFFVSPHQLSHTPRLRFFQPATPPPVLMIALLLTFAPFRFSGFLCVVWKKKAFVQVLTSISRPYWHQTVLFDILFHLPPAVSFPPLTSSGQFSCIYRNPAPLIRAITFYPLSATLLFQDTPPRLSPPDPGPSAPPLSLNRECFLTRNPAQTPHLVSFSRC